MLQIAISGICGKMGRVLAESIKERDGCEVCGGIDLADDSALGVEIAREPAGLSKKPDVIIDYSRPEALEKLLAYCTETKTPAVLATTGYSEEQMARMKAASEKVAIFSSFNMSLGIQLLIALSKKAAAVLGPNFDIEIIEKHHNRKVDAPSGTALMLADAVAQGKHPVYSRHERKAPRDPDEIGIHSVRGGTIVGEHEVLFAGPDEVISLKHTAASKRVFAEGSLNAAFFVAGQPAGLYNMEDLLKVTD